MFTRKTAIVVGAVLLLAGIFLVWKTGTDKRGPAPSTAQTQEGIDLREPDKGPAEITAADNGKAFSYSVGAHFTVVLDSNKYPENALSCAPPSSGVVRAGGSASEVQPPFYGRPFEVVGAGTCTMTNTGFIVAIVAK